jgi:DNA invertase Pin-like site-specific DNA recombinase
MRVIGYTRVSTEEQKVSGLGLLDQQKRIAGEASNRDWKVRHIEDAGYSAKDLKRPGIQEALTLLASGKADGLVVAKLDRLSRSLMDFAALMERARKEGWALIALDLGVDTTTPAGEMMANVMATFAHYERRLIGQRTKDALAQLKAQGYRLGRPRINGSDVVALAVRWRKRGKTLRAIADHLTTKGFTPAHGGQRWYPSTVRGLLRSAALDKEASRAPRS